MNPSEEIAVKYWGKNNEASYDEIVERVANYLYPGRQEMFITLKDDMLDKRFMFNSPVYMNAGTNLKSLAACFVLPLEDSMDSIFTCARDMAMVMKEGGGVGISLSKLRPEGATVKTTKGVSSGPISFLKVYDAVVGAVKQGGTRRGAALANISVHHPDVLSFIEAKKNEGDISNFNLSVAITDSFMKAVIDGKRSHFQFGDDMESMPAKEIWDAIIDGMWENGEPGLQFIDTVNRPHREYLEHYKEFVTGIETSNPCSETFLKSYESCILGHINLYKYVFPFWRTEDKQKGSINWNTLDTMVKRAVDYLNNVLEKTRTPLQKINEETLKSRKIGLGVMGMADALSAFGVAYDSDEGRNLAKSLMEFITSTAEEYSTKKGYRNASLTLVAPTGTTGVVANVSGGIEPHFRVAYNRHSLKAGNILMVSQSFGDFLNYISKGKDVSPVLSKLKKAGGKFESDDMIAGSPVGVLWPTADQINHEDHIKMCAEIQKSVHNAISKTINLPNSATREDVSEAAMMAWNMGLKGFTVYRDGSRDEQVLMDLGTDKEKETAGETAPEAPSHEKCSCNKICSGEETKRDRPQVTRGESTKVKTGCGNLYVTTNRDDSGPCEVFTSLGRAGGCPSQSESTSRLISLALRAGISPEDVAEQLIGIRCMSTISRPKKGRLPSNKIVLSCPDAIGKCLRQFSEDTAHLYESKIKLVPDNAETTNVSTPVPEYGLSKCPNCVSTLAADGGCLVCKACGYSKCG